MRRNERNVLNFEERFSGLYHDEKYCMKEYLCYKDAFYVFEFQWRGLTHAHVWFDLKTIIIHQETHELEIEFSFHLCLEI
jgi:hypothetical protein